MHLGSVSLPVLWSLKPCCQAHDQRAPLPECTLLRPQNPLQPTHQLHQLHHVQPATGSRSPPPAGLRPTLPLGPGSLGRPRWGWLTETGGMRWSFHFIFFFFSPPSPSGSEFLPVTTGTCLGLRPASILRLPLPSLGVPLLFWVEMWNCMSICVGPQGSPFPR